MDSQRRRHAQTDLKATSHDLAADARRVAAIEEVKATLDLEDPRLVPLAEASEALTKDMVTKAKVESKLAREAVAETQPRN